MEDDRTPLPGPDQGHNFGYSRQMTPYSEEFLAELESLMDIKTHAVKLNPGNKLFWQNGPADRFYLIVSGCFKESHVDQTGYESIVEFYYSNELMGLESLGEQTYDNTAEAITQSWVYPIPCPHLKTDLFQRVPQLEHYVWGVMGEKITAARRRVRLHMLSSADQKLATFLLARLRHFDETLSTPLYVPMARQDIASYLGMSPETVSRLFTRFEAHGLIHCTKKHVEIIDYAGLTALLHIDEQPPSLPGHP